MITKLDRADRFILEQMINVQRAAYSVEAELIGTRNIPPLNETIEELEAVHDEEFFGFVMDGELMGFVATMDESPHLRISRMVVDPKFFKNGIGKALVLYVLNHRKPGQPVKVTTGEKNLPARRLYERFGFRLERSFEVEDGTAIIELIRLKN